MDAIVQCQLLFATLTHEEKDIFVTTITQHFKSDFMATVVFDFYARKISQFQYDFVRDNAVSSLNKTLGDILKQRRKQNIKIREQEQQQQQLAATVATTTPLNIQRLPSAIISYVASFLYFHDVVDLQNCSRAMLVGARSMPLHVMCGHFQSFLDFSIQSDRRLFCKRYFECFRINKHQQVQFHDDMIPALELNEVASWVKVNEMRVALDVHQCPRVARYLFNALSMCNLRALWAKINVVDDAFCDALRQLSSLETLSISLGDYAPDHQSVVSSECMSRMALALSKMSNLRYLELEDATNVTNFSPLLYAVANRLHQLLVESASTVFTNCHFDELKELCLKSPTLAVINSLEIDSFSSLRKVHIKSLVSEVMQDAEVANIRMFASLFALPSLQQINIHCHESAPKLCLASAIQNITEGFLTWARLTTTTNRDFLDVFITGHEGWMHEQDHILFATMMNLWSALEENCARFHFLVVLKDCYIDYTQRNHWEARTTSTFSYRCYSDDDGDTSSVSALFEMKSKT
mmetsp:Transcript_33429/g.54400  ORF Transcript_33429/g.54400 Transcript_33429/m.54400 type:complete len:522 (+) Transcript_33429:57-1622(+)